MAYIGLDVGTTGVKATVMTADGESITSAHREYDLRFPKHGWVEMRPADVWEGAKDVISRVVRASNEKIEAIATASFGEAAVLLDEKGQSVRDSIFYTDVRGTDELDDLRATVNPDMLELRTGMPINYMYTLPKLMWLKKHQPEVLTKTKKMLLYGSFVEYMLTGIAATDASLASRTLMFDRQKLDWDAEVCEKFGIPRGILPDYVPAGDVIGNISRAIAEELGLSPDAKVVSGVHDQIATALGCGALACGDVADGIGGAECLIAPLPADPNYAEMFRGNICAEPHAVKGTYVALAFTNTAGAALKWYRDTFETELKARCEVSGENAYAILNSHMRNEPSPILFLPYLAGTGTPYMDGNATAMFAGMSLATTRTDIYRAIYEGMNFELKVNFELLKRTGFTINALTSGGGGASEEALHIKADILETPIWMPKNRQSGTVGMAMLCGVAMGRFADFSEAADALVKREKLIEPCAKHRNRYREKFGQYLKMYEASRLIYGRK
ncbi:MAG: FGGY-family carbohydrate kinase [Christensenellales bacterium]